MASIIYLFSDSFSHCHRRSRYVLLFVRFLYIVTKPMFIYILLILFYFVCLLCSSEPRPQTPPYRGAVFIFYVLKRNRGYANCANPIGSAVAIKCESNTVLLTAGHCCFSDPDGNRRLTNNLFCTLTMAKSSDGLYVPGTSFPVTIVYASIIPDIGIIKRSDGSPILCTQFPLCSPVDIPWESDPDGWDCKVKCYHCPVDVFKTTDQPMLSCNISNYNSVAAHSTSHFTITEEFIGGSSGGAMILERGHKLLGILITTMGTPMTLDDVEDELVGDNRSYTYSVVTPSVTYTTAIVPAMVKVHATARRILSIPDYLVSKRL
jgi:hypothetical protein